MTDIGKWEEELKLKNKEKEKLEKENLKWELRNVSIS